MTMSKVLWIAHYQSAPDADKLAAYAEIAGPAVRAAGGRVISRGIPLQTYENGIAQRVIVIEFDSIEAARQMHDSEDYQRALAALDGGAERDIRIVECL
jgi:uncharacterized protein (DUF1330 family)